ncbi:abortive infection family protein [Mycolicibacterium wolinskyi]|uniref:abortive infection family protein n=1 Tax=Mycolicibacterium wolinskyi TaxID=59750 RepID=UPI003917A5A4
MADDFDLAPPVGIDAQAWRTVIAHRDRLKGSVTHSADRSLVIGQAKELAECVARVVVTERGGVAPANMDYVEAIEEAHSVLQRQPGRDLTQDPELREVVQGAKKIVRRLREIRNSFGSGHGRAREPVVELEMVDVTVAAAMLWVRWALRRLESLIFGQPTTLINDLLNGGVFYGGQLAERLRAANIADLDGAMQRRLGNAVGVRAMRETFNVRIEGVEACAESSALDRWPPDYRRGVVYALLLDEAGRARTTEWALSMIPPLLGPIDGQAEVLSELATSLSTERFTTGDWGRDHQLYSVASSLTPRLKPAARPIWKEITRLLDPGAF